MKKKTISASFAAIIAATISIAADNVFKETVNGIEWTYRVVDGEAVLGGNNGERTIQTSTFGAISIPEMLGGYMVEGIGGCAFQGCSALTRVTLPSKLRYIAIDAFRGCSGLMTINIPNGVESIGSRCFYSCSNINSISLPDSITNINGEAFHGCSNLRDINIPKNLTIISDALFQYCPYPSVDIPDGVTKIGVKAFSWGGCGSEHIYIPNSVVEIKSSAFEHGGVRNITIPGSVVSLGASTFYESNLTNVVLESGVPYISANMFSRTPLENIVIADTVSIIGNSAFSGCSKLKNPVFPSVLNTIGNNAFQGCSTITEVIIPANVEIVGGYAFKDCINLKSIRFLGDAPMADAVTFENTHPDCTAYVSRKSTGWGVAIPGEWMGIKIDYYDPALYTVRFDANGGSLGTATNEVSYGDGEALRNFPRPSKDGCSFVGWFTTADGGICVTEGMLVSADMTLYAHWKDAAPELTIENGVLVHVALNGEKSIEIPSVVTSISANAFSECQEMERVTIPESVTYIPLATFANCDKLWASWYKTMANGGSGMESVSLTVTNVVVHYIATSMQNEAVTPPETTGIVSVIAEVTSGGPVAIASTWAEQYPGFEAKFGSDFTAALTKQVGKLDGSGRPMMVWQDFVAGTDPTNPDDKFTASITFDAQGKPVISYSPELSATETAKRIYRKFGKVKLNDENWIPIANGEEVNYNFFKVTVEMK